MYSSNFTIIPMSVVASLISMVSQRQHILMCLLSLEMMILMLTLMTMSMYPTELYSIIIILSMGACEASLGLSCLVAMTRSFGNDYIKSSNSNKC